METSCSKPSQPGLETEIKKEYEIEIKLEFGPNAVEEEVIREGGFGDHINATKAVDDLIAKILKTVTKSEVLKFKCQLCDYSARDNYNLKRHSEIQHSEVLVKCLICTNEFSSKHSYEEHLNDCFYSCPYNNCSKKFKIKRRFESHNRMHIKLLSRY